MYLHNMKIGNNTFELKEFLTARDNRNINRAMMSKVKLGVDGKPESIGYDSVEERENALISCGVVSINGSKENVLEKTLELPAPEYNELLSVLNAMQGIKEEKKGA